MNHFPPGHAHVHILHHPEHLLAVPIAHPSKFGKEDAVVVLFKPGALRITKAIAPAFLLEDQLSDKLAAAHPAMLQIPQRIEASRPGRIEVFQGLLQSLRRSVIQPGCLFVLFPIDQHSTQIIVVGMGPAEFEELFLQCQPTIENEAGRTCETAHLSALVLVGPQFKAVRLESNLP